MSGAASNIVATLKAKIKETADELEKYEGMCEENRWEQKWRQLYCFEKQLHMLLAECATGRNRRRPRRLTPRCSASTGRSSSSRTTSRGTRTGQTLTTVISRRYIFTWHCFPRLELLNGKNQSASDRLSTSEDRRQTIETAFETSNEKIEVLEAQVRHHRNIKSKHVNVNNMWIRWISCMSFYRIKT